MKKPKDASSVAMHSITVTLTMNNEHKIEFEILTNAKKKDLNILLNDWAFYAKYLTARSLVKYLHDKSYRAEHKKDA